MPSWKQKFRIMHRYNQSARVYETLYSEEQEAKIKTLMQNLVLKRNSVVLDAGCGTGLLIKHLANRSEFFVGVDISKGLLQEALKKARLCQNVALVLADADNMPFHDGIFGAVFGITLLQNVPNLKVTLTEVMRVSKQTAPIVVTGLRKQFTLKDFVKTLNHAGLRVDRLKLDEMDRECVCICRKVRR